MRRGTAIKAGGIIRTITSVIFIIILIGAVVIGVWAQDNYVMCQEYIYESGKIPKAFTGYRIVQISDLANDTSRVYSAVIKAKPDIILVTGNLADKDGNFDKSVELIEKLGVKYNVIYTLGVNDTKYSASIKERIGLSGVCVEDSRCYTSAPKITYDDFIKEYIGKTYIKKATKGDENALKYLEYTKQALEESKDSSIVITGLSVMTDNTDYIDKAYTYMDLDRELFQILMFNQCEYADELTEVDTDMIFTGNTFGLSSDTCKYKRGLFNSNGTTIIVSGGIGNLPEQKRWFNMPQIVAVTLSDGTIENLNPLEKFLSMFISDVNTRFENDGGFQEYRYRYE